MPRTCCCRSNVQVAQILGMLFLLVEIIDGIFLLYSFIIEDKKEFEMYLFDCRKYVAQFTDTFFNGILVFGATQRNRTAILIWMVLAIIKLIYDPIAAIILFITKSQDDY